jgi:two-component system chemotaxis response regulator CheY
MAQTVLIVDDAAFVREVLTQILSRHGFEVAAEAHNGQEAVDIALSRDFDIIMMDIVMPIKSGIQATQEILKQKPDSTIIAFSTEGSESMVMKALEAGCVDFVVKPFQIENLIRTIRSNLAKKGAK